MHQRRGVQAEAGAEGRRGARQSRASATQRRAAERRPSIADGTALHRGRVGSRHFQKPLGFVLGASLFVGVIIPFPAAVGISFRAMPCIKCPSSFSLAPFHSAKILGEKKSSLSSFFVSLRLCPDICRVFYVCCAECHSAFPFFPLCRVGACGVGGLPLRRRSIPILAFHRFLSPVIFS